MGGCSGVISALETELRTGSGHLSQQNLEKLTHVVQSKPREFLECLLDRASTDGQMRPQDPIGKEIWRRTIERYREQEKDDLVKVAYTTFYRLDAEAKHRLVAITYGLLDGLGIFLSLGYHRAGAWLSGRFINWHIKKVTQRYDELIYSNGVE